MDWVVNADMPKTEHICRRDGNLFFPFRLKFRKALFLYIFLSFILGL